MSLPPLLVVFFCPSVLILPWSSCYYGLEMTSPVWGSAPATITFALTSPAGDASATPLLFLIAERVSSIQQYNPI